MVSRVRIPPGPPPLPQLSTRAGVVVFWGEWFERNSSAQDLQACRASRHFITIRNAEEYF